MRNLWCKRSFRGFGYNKFLPLHKIKKTTAIAPMEVQTYGNSPVLYKNKNKNKYQTLERVFYLISKHLEVHKNTHWRLILFNPLFLAFGNWVKQSRFPVFDIFIYLNTGLTILSLRSKCHNLLLFSYR